jgi:hypothetical protein
MQRGARPPQLRLNSDQTVVRSRTLHASSIEIHSLRVLAREAATSRSPAGAHGEVARTYHPSLLLRIDEPAAADARVAELVADARRVG